MESKNNDMSDQEILNEAQEIREDIKVFIKDKPYSSEAFFTALNQVLVGISAETKMDKKSFLLIQNHFWDEYQYNLNILPKMKHKE